MKKRPQEVTAFPRSSRQYKVRSIAYSNPSLRQKPPGASWHGGMLPYWFFAKIYRVNND